MGTGSVSTASPDSGAAVASSPTACAEIRRGSGADSPSRWVGSPAMAATAGSTSVSRFPSPGP